ncbi:hypothetical protein PSDVSF_34660 [Pseudodesulfovibrio sediminis]|uniref:Uncharacterized protein n=2 Tax=Pseudodesulfovibrio sediminis TaxID=2810563 RepID=A0ABN6EYI5_9BACT|nr:hypothetical protein PSDVSF_34660 [Pseudodesulfovibrio sediminis]
MWQLYRTYRLPGVGWWILGALGVASASLFAAIGVYVGVWARAVVSHILLIGGVGALWLGARLFFGEGVDKRHYVLYGLLLIGSTCSFYWLWAVNPMYQARLALDSILLLIISLAISQSYFASMIKHRAVVITGVLYSLFALANGFRCVNIILFPKMDSYFLSGIGAIVLTFIMAPVLVVALASKVLIIREKVRLSAEDEQ